MGSWAGPALTPKDPGLTCLEQSEVERTNGRTNQPTTQPLKPLGSYHPHRHRHRHHLHLHHHHHHHHHHHRHHYSHDHRHHHHHLQQILSKRIRSSTSFSRPTPTPSPPCPRICLHLAAHWILLIVFQWPQNHAIQFIMPCTLTFT